MNSIISKMQTNNKFTEFIEDIKNKKGPICVSGLSDVYKAQLIGATKENLKNTCLIITYNEIQAKKIYDDVKQFEKNTFIFFISVIFLPSLFPCFFLIFCSEQTAIYSRFHRSVMSCL